MASVCNDKGGKKRILFFLGGKRLALRLGKTTQKAAQNVRTHIEAILAARESGQPLDRLTALWLGEIGDGLHGRLEELGLVQPRVREEVRTLGRLIEEFLAARPDIKETTRKQILQATGRMVEFFGAETDIAGVTPEDALAFYRRQLERGHAQNTARRRAGRAKEVFAFAARKRWLAENPFAEVAVRTGSNPDRKKYVPVEVIERVLAEIPDDHQFRLIVALARHAGLRCPSEHLALTWRDVDLDRGRFVVRSPKTGPREVPIFPRLRPYLVAALEARDPSSPWVVTYRRGQVERAGHNTNWRNRLMGLIESAGLEPWPKVFHALRASCETDLCEDFPLHVVCAWIGNSAAVAREHYLVVTEDHFRRAGLDPCGAAQSAAHRESVLGDDGVFWGPENESAPEENRENAGISGADGLAGMTPRGLSENQNSAEHPENATCGSALSGALSILHDFLTSGQRAAIRRHLDPVRAVEVAAILLAEFQGQ